MTKHSYVHFKAMILFLIEKANIKIICFMRYLSESTFTLHIMASKRKLLRMHIFLIKGNLEFLKQISVAALTLFCYIHGAKQRNIMPRKQNLKIYLFIF